MHAFSDWMLLFWAAMSGALSMLLYGWLAPQSRIRKLQRISARVQQRLRSYEGDFRGAMALSRRNVKLAFRRLGLAAGPSLLAGIPVIAVMIWVLPAYENRMQWATAAFFLAAACSALTAKFALKIA
jgi:hypothetical protein